MKVLMLSLDQSALRANSPLAERLKNYAALLEELIVIVPFSQKVPDVILNPKPELWLCP